MIAIHSSTVLRDYNREIRKHHPPFIDRKTKAERGNEICGRSLRQPVEPTSPMSAISCSSHKITPLPQSRARTRAPSLCHSLLRPRIPPWLHLSPQHLVPEMTLASDPPPAFQRPITGARPTSLRSRSVREQEENAGSCRQRGSPSPLTPGAGGRLQTERSPPERGWGQLAEGPRRDRAGGRGVPPRKGLADRGLPRPPQTEGWGQRGPLGRG